MSSVVDDIYVHCEPKSVAVRLQRKSGEHSIVQNIVPNIVYVKNVYNIDVASQIVSQSGLVIIVTYHRQKDRHNKCIHLVEDNFKHERHHRKYEAVHVV